MYSILIRDPRTNNYRFFTVNKEDNPSTSQITNIGTGRDDVVVFSTSSLETLEIKCIELLKKHKTTDIVPINVLNYSTDLVWGITEDSDKDVFENEDMDFSDFFEDEDSNTDGDDTTKDGGEEIENDNEKTD